MFLHLSVSHSVYRGVQNADHKHNKWGVLVLVADAWIFQMGGSVPVPGPGMEETPPRRHCSGSTHSTGNAFLCMNFFL